MRTLWRWFWSNDDYDWLGAPVPWRWTVRVILLGLLAALLWLVLTARDANAQSPDSARVEGVSVRFQWPSIAGADSARLTVKDSASGKSYFNARVSTRTKTRAVTIPAKGASYRSVERCLRVYGIQMAIQPCRYFPQYAAHPAPGDSLPADTAIVVTPPADVYVPEPSTVAELPRIWIDTRMPATTRTVPVTCSTLQGALDAAQDGDRIQLPPGVTCTGNVVLRGQHTRRVVVTTATPLPAEGTRADSLSPTYAKLLTPNSAPALAAVGMASGWRVVGVYLGATPANKGLVYSLVSLGDVERSLDSLAHDITLDRVVVQGHDSLQTQRCVIMNGAREAVIDSWLAGCHAKGYDAQAVFSAFGPGPYKIVGNYLEASGQGIMFGGADPPIAGLVPSDIEIRRNHFVKPLWWHRSDGSSVFTIKNHLESKNSQRVLVEANVMEHTWADGQDEAIILKSENQSGRCTWCHTGDYTVRYNRVVDAPKAAVLAATQVTVNGGPSVPMSRVEFVGNAFQQVGQTGRWTLQVGGNLTDVIFDRNTFDGTYAAIYFAAGESGGVPRATTSIAFTNNQLAPSRFGILGDAYAGVSAWTTYCPACRWSGNTVTSGALTSYPTGTTIGNAGIEASALEARLAGVE